jgi:ComF family protein
LAGRASHCSLEIELRRSFVSRMHRLVLGVGHRVLNFFFPQYCEGCGQSSGSYALCESCRALVTAPSSPLCTICGLPFGGSGEDHLCGRCLSQRPHFAHARACTTYDRLAQQEAPVTRLLHRFKYTPDVTLAPTLGSLLASCSFLPGPHNVVIPVPLHPQRLRWRGFNQALLLARSLGQHRSVRVEPFALKRTRSTPPQVGLNVRERHRNIAGAFAVRDPDAVRGLSVLLVDDVYTTGATVNECARVLRRAGARRVEVIVLARAVVQ